MPDTTTTVVGAVITETNYAGGAAGAEFAMTQSNTGASFTACNYPMGEQTIPYKEFERESIKSLGQAADTVQTFIKGYKYKDAQNKFYAQNATWVDAVITGTSGTAPTSFYWKWIQPKGQIDAYGCVIKTYHFVAKGNDWPSETLDWLYYDVRGAHQELGLSGKVGTDNTALSTSTTYTYMINGTEYSITTVLDITYTAVLNLINAASGHIAYAELVGGDVRFTRAGFGALNIVPDNAGNDLVSTMTANVAIEAASPDISQECGLAGKAFNTDPSIANGTYYFKINGVEYDITTSTTDSFLKLIRLINEEIKAVAVCTLIGGDLRFSSIGRATTTAIAVTAGTTGTDLLTTLSITMDAAANTYITKAFSTTQPTIHKDLAVSLDGTTYTEVSDLDLKIEPEFEDAFVLGKYQRLKPYVKSRKTTATVTFYDSSPDLINELGGE